MSKSTTPLTPAQLAARQANAKNSTGPRTDEGKARAAQNALLHGLCSLAPVLPGEDPAEFERMLAQWIKEMDPGNADERRMVYDMCCAARAADRVRDADAAAAAIRIREAGEAWDRARAATLAAATALRSPADLERLLARADGVRRLIADWEEEDAALAAGESYCPNSLAWAAARLGCDANPYDDDALQEPRVRAFHTLGLALQVDGGAGHEANARFRAAGIVPDTDRPRERFRAIIAGELEALRALLPGLEAEEAEQRRQAMDAAAVDTSDEGARRHRYLQDHQRTFRQLSTALIACKNARLKLYGRILSGSENEPAWTPTAATPPAPQAPPRNEPKNDATPEYERRFDGSYGLAAPRPASSVVVGVAPTTPTAPPRRF
ncbi:MAG TPA: hypothetical protein VG406_28160 [Isosphaeraceae bacterium]|jgi:hypothetical protein|nr:hypothetical protein [Isosphaeraceae bacterium]